MQKSRECGAACKPDITVWVGWYHFQTAVDMEASMLMINVVTTINSCALVVDRSKPKASPRLQQSSQPNQSVGTQNGVQANKDEREDQNIQQLKQLLVDSDCRFQAVAVVLQHTLAEVRKCS